MTPLVLASAAVRLSQSGMLPCLRHGFSSFFSLSIASERQMRLRVSWGMITSSMKPRWPAMKGLANFSLYSFSARGDLRRIAHLLAEDDLDRALGSHDRDLGGGPGEIHVAAQVLGRHHVIGPAVGLAGDDA